MKALNEIVIAMRTWWLCVSLSYSLVYVLHTLKYI